MQFMHACRKGTRYLVSCIGIHSLLSIVLFNICAKWINSDEIPVLSDCCERMPAEKNKTNKSERALAARVSK